MRIDPLLAAVAFILAATTGLITNIATNSPSWSLFALLAALVIFGAWVAWYQQARQASNTRKRATRVHQVARGGARISRSRIHARTSSTVEEVADQHGVIENSTINAGNSTNVVRRVKGASIEGSDIVAD